METIDRVRAEFYQWIQEDVIRELDSDLHFLRQVKSTMGILSCQYFDSLSDSKRTDTLTALSRKFLQNNKNSIGQELNINDELRWQEFEKAIFVEPLNPEVLDVFFTEESIKERKNLDVRLLRSEVKKACGPYLGSLERSTGEVFSYTANVGKFVITSEIDLGGWSQLRYLHFVHFNDGTSTSRAPVIMTNFLRWLGLGETSWDFMTDEEIPDVAVVMSQLCDNFMEGVKPLLQSL